MSNYCNCTFRTIGDTPLPTEVLEAVKSLRWYDESKIQDGATEACAYPPIKKWALEIIEQIAQHTDLLFIYSSECDWYANHTLHISRDGVWVVIARWEVPVVTQQSEHSLKDLYYQGSKFAEIPKLPKEEEKIISTTTDEEFLKFLEQKEVE